MTEIFVFIIDISESKELSRLIKQDKLNCVISWVPTIAHETAKVTYCFIHRRVNCFTNIRVQPRPCCDFVKCHSLAKYPEFDPLDLVPSLSVVASGAADYVLSRAAQAS